VQKINDIQSWLVAESGIFFNFFCSLTHSHTMRIGGEEGVGIRVLPIVAPILCIMVKDKNDATHLRTNERSVLFFCYLQHTQKIKN
jgi:hypothetical protein